MCRRSHLKPSQKKASSDTPCKSGSSATTDVDQNVQMGTLKTVTQKAKPTTSEAGIVAAAVSGSGSKPVVSQKPQTKPGPASFKKIVTSNRISVLDCEMRDDTSEDRPLPDSPKKL